nr:MAK10-like protein [Tanacetum cinerariifolium]
MRKQLKPREDPKSLGGISNFTGRVKGIHIFVGNFTYVSDFIIVEDISSSIEPGLSQVVLEKPFVELTNMTHDLSLGIVGYEVYEGAHLDRDWPFNKEVMKIEEVKYGEFEKSFPNNGGKRVRYRVCPSGYYTHVKSRPPFRERKPSLGELINNHIEESTRGRNEKEEWMKKLQENTDIKNQNAALKNLET